jgi:hypothetical protein
MNLWVSTRKDKEKIFFVIYGGESKETKMWYEPGEQGQFVFRELIMLPSFRDVS